MSRLIDANFVIYAAESEFPEDDAAKVRWLISHIPTIGAEPVRHGRWIKDKDDVFWGNHFIHKRCSECGKEPPVSRFGTGYALSRYCPNCGAKMDEEVRDD